MGRCLTQRTSTPLSRRVPHRAQGDVHMQVLKVRQRAPQRIRLRAPVMSVPQTKKKMSVPNVSEVYVDAFWAVCQI